MGSGDMGGSRLIHFKVPVLLDQRVQFDLRRQISENLWQKLSENRWQDKIPQANMVSGHFVLCHFNRCNFNRSHFQPRAISTACNFNREPFQPPQIRPLQLSSNQLIIRPQSSFISSSLDFVGVQSEERAMLEK